MTENIRNVLNTFDTFDEPGEESQQLEFNQRLADDYISWEEMQGINADGILQNKKLNDLKDIGYMVADDLDIKSEQISDLQDRVSGLEEEMISAKQRITQLESALALSVQAITDSSSQITSLQQDLQIVKWQLNASLDSPPVPTEFPLVDPLSSVLLSRIKVIESQLGP